MGNQGWLHRSCGLRARRKRSRGQAERADGKPECGELYRGGPRLSGPIHRRFSLFAQKNSEVGAAAPTSKRAILASPPLFTPIGGRTWVHRPGWRAPERPATAPRLHAGNRLYLMCWGCTSLLSAQVYMGRPVTYWDSWGLSRPAAAFGRCSGLCILASAQVCMGKPITYWDSWGLSLPAAASRRCSGSDP